MNGSAEHNLDWQAFAYWSDELAPSERREFESLLEDDQQAREALARVVELSHAVIAAESLAAPDAAWQATHCEPAGRPSARPWRQVAAWSAGLAASALALLLGISIGQRPQWSPPAQVSVKQIDPDLASAWSDIRGSWDELTTWQQVAAVEHSTETVDVVEARTASDWDAADLETPSWMTAAVLGQAAEGEDGSTELPATDSLPDESSKES